MLVCFRDLESCRYIALIEGLYLVVILVLTSLVDANAEDLGCVTIARQLSSVCTDIGILEVPAPKATGGFTDKLCKLRCNNPNVAKLPGNYLTISYRKFSSTEESKRDFDLALSFMQGRDKGEISTGRKLNKSYFLTKSGASAVILDGVQSQMISFPILLNLTSTNQNDFKKQVLDALIDAPDGCCPAGSAGPDMLGNMSCQVVCGCWSCETLKSFGGCADSICK